MPEVLKISFCKSCVVFGFVLLHFNSPFAAEKKATSAIKLDRIAIIGNEKISRGQIQNWLEIRKGDFVTEEQVKLEGQKVLQRLMKEGFYFASFDSIQFHYKKDSTRVDVLLHLNEGGKARVGDFVVHGLIGDPKDLVGKLRTASGGDFDEKLLRDDIDLIIRQYEEAGYPFCTVEITRLDLEKSHSKNEALVALELQVEPGQQVAIDEIEIRGNEQTQESVILRELPFRPGDIYDQQKIERVASKLQRLGYFKWVNPPRLELLQDHSGRLIIELAEGRYNRFDGVIGYNPGTQSKSGFVTGLLDISFGNLFGTGRHIEAYWERKTEETQEMRLRYLEPWVFGFPLNIAFSFEQLIQDTSYVQRNVGLDFNFAINDNLLFFSGIKKRNVSPDSLGGVRFGIPKSSSVNLTAGISYSTLDNLLNPQSGLQYTSSFEWGRKNVNGDSSATGVGNSFNQKRLHLDFETYLPLFRWQVMAFAIHGRQVTSDEPIIPVTEQYRFGGTNTLRGYREEQFRGSRIAWSSLEYRYLLGRLSRFFIFTDAGYFFREELDPDGINKRQVQNWKIGYGFGLRINTGLGLFGIDYGLGEGDGLSDGKVHIRLANEF